MNTINNNKNKVNTEITFDEYLESLKVEVDFEGDIKTIISNEEKEELFRSKIKQERFIKVRRKQVAFERQCPKLFSLVPECQKTAVAWQIKKYFQNDPVLYSKSISKFFTFFDKKKKAICDEAIALGDEERKKKNKLRKDYLLYSSQLLGLVGGAFGSWYINDSLLNIYVDDQKAQQAYYDAFRLVNAKGQVRRLVSLEKKKEVQRARILNISSALAQIAVDKGFTFSLITFTEPPAFHGNAIVGSSASYKGYLPSEGHAFLERMGQQFRALLAKDGMRAGEDYFGCSVFEAMRSSVGHKHYLIYHAIDKTENIRLITKGMRKRVAEEFNCSAYKIDFKTNDGRKNGNGAAYIFKYITKTIGEIEQADDTQLRNMAVRWYHSARAFNFFGIKQAVTKFNFLCDCVEQYKGYYSDEVYQALSNYDYYTFISKYEQYFKIVRDDKSKVKFITYDLAGNFRAPKLKGSDALKARAQVIIEKKVFSIFECPKDMENVGSLVDIKQENYMCGAFDAWESVKIKQDEYDADIKTFANASGIASHVAGNVSLNEVMNKHYSEWKEEINSFFDVVVTVKEKLSSGDPSPSSENQKTDVYSLRLSDKVNQKIKNLIDERRKNKGLVAQA
ncbi:TPA: replication endonuclease [Burkholderia vietnamiensis]|uniref:replication endonuclease n=1 Tax=Burkholderia vietnamiensis TaxID=60552 RepID=UPI00264DC868|nr:replication endonuclease [Burkholderia vietnamiensis]MDN8113013.1 replication endonuclease [Burkholderia vietnamiensis]HDR9137711.1 replication endonuclease [Burkholderia vietnamiensis]